MSLLSELNAIISPLVPLETGVFSEPAPDRYAVITPMVDMFELYTDDKPRHEVQEARISLFDKGSYTVLKNQIVRILLDADFIITDRRYVSHEDDTGYDYFVVEFKSGIKIQIDE